VESIFTHDYRPTMGVKISKRSVKAGDFDVDFSLWDLEGLDDREQLQSSYVGHTQAYILVADVTRSISLDRAIELQTGIAGILPHAPFVLALNKSDLAPEIAESRFASLDPAWNIVRTSARTGDGVEEIFNVLARRVIERPYDAQNSSSRAQEPEEGPKEKLEFFRLRPAELRIENPPPIEVPAGVPQVRIGMAMRGEVASADPSLCTVRCRCPMRKDVTCVVIRHETEDRIDAIIEIPGDMSTGDELTCEFQVASDGWLMSKPLRVLIV
jgi:hypothetical protein